MEKQVEISLTELWWFIDVMLEVFEDITVETTLLESIERQTEIYRALFVLFPELSPESSILDVTLKLKETLEAANVGVEQSVSNGLPRVIEES